jgi:NADH:ubiquinone oxidoreductase subunit E
MIELTVCVGSACHIRGSYNVINRFQQLIARHRVAAEVTVKAALCLGACSGKVSVRVGDGPVVGLMEPETEAFFLREILPCCIQNT